MVEEVKLEEEKKGREGYNKYKTIIGKEYMSMNILIFRLTVLVIFIIGFGLGAWLV